MYNVFNLTPMTGREAKGERHTTFLTIDMTRRTLMVVLGAGLPGFAFTAILFPLMGMWATLTMPVFLGIGFYFFHMKSRDGLEQRKYKQFINRAKSNNGKFMRGMTPVEIGKFELKWIVRTVGEVPFEMLNEPLQKQVDYERWQREDQHRFQEQVWRENQVKESIRQDDQARADRAQAQNERRKARKAKMGAMTGNLKPVLGRSTVENTKERNAG